MRALLLAVGLVLAVPTAQAPGVVTETRTEGNWGVAALQTRLDGQRRYILQIDGPPGVPFTVRYMQVYVSRSPQNGGSGNDDGLFEAATPYEVDIGAPAPQLVFWRYSLVVSPQEPAELSVRILDRGPR